MAHRRHQWATLSPERKQQKIDYNRARRRVTGSGRTGCQRWRWKLKQEVLSAYGNQCTCCGESRFEFLTLDHVNNDGADHRRAIAKKLGRVASGHVLYYWAKTHGYPSMLQVLCWNCNCAKHYFGSCPHKSLPAHQAQVSVVPLS